MGFLGLNHGPVFVIIQKNWGHSSAGRALQWHCRGRRFDPAWLHHPIVLIFLMHGPDYRSACFFVFLRTDSIGFRF